MLLSKRSTNTINSFSIGLLTFLVYFPETEKVNDYNIHITKYFASQVVSKSFHSTKLNADIIELPDH